MEKALKLEMLGICAEHSVKVRQQEEQKKAEESVVKIERMKFRLLILLGIIVATAIICNFGETALWEPIVTLKIVAVYESAKFIVILAFRLVKKAITK